MIRVAVSGLGKMGSGYDKDNLGPPLSHIGAIMAMDGMLLTAAFDPSAQVRKNTASQWTELKKTVLREDLAQLESKEADVIVICSPTPTHYKQALVAISKEPKIIVLEKPASCSIQETKTIIDLAEKQNIQIRVNFHRRFDPQLINFQTQMPGIPELVIARYTKGLYNYGSHMVDLMINWFGLPQSVQSFSSLGAGTDPNLSFVCNFDSGLSFVFTGIDNLNYDQFEADFFFSNTRLELANGGVEKRYYLPTDDLYYKGYRQLQAHNLFFEPKQISGLIAFYENIHNHLLINLPLGGCTGYEALLGQSIIDSAITSALNQNKIISTNNSSQLFIQE